MLEEGSFRGRSADFVMMFLFGGIFMIVSLESWFSLQAHSIYSYVFNFTDLCVLCESSVSGASVHDNVSVRLVAT